MSRVLVLGLLSSTALASAELDRAVGLAQQLKYEQAALVVPKLLADPALSRAELCSALELGGVVSATLRQPAKAVEYFTRLLSLSPDHQLTSGYPPRVMTPFYQARSAIQRTGPLAAVRAPADSTGERVRVTFTVRNADVPKVTRARLHVGVDAVLHPVEVPVTAGAVEVPTDGPFVRWWAELLDEAGRVVLVVGDASQPFEDGARPAPVVVAEPAHTPPPMVTSVSPAPRGPSAPMVAGLVLAGGALVSLGVGVGFGVSAQSARRDFAAAGVDGDGLTVGLTRNQALALSERAQVDARTANIAWAIAGGLAAAAVVSITIGAVVVQPLPGGVAGTF